MFVKLPDEGFHIFTYKEQKIRCFFVPTSCDKYCLQIYCFQTVMSNPALCELGKLETSPSSERILVLLAQVGGCVYISSYIYPAEETCKILLSVAGAVGH
jgi:hypothetical protein